MQYWRRTITVLEFNLSVLQYFRYTLLWYCSIRLERSISVVDPNLTVLEYCTIALLHYYSAVQDNCGVAHSPCIAIPPPQLPCGRPAIVGILDSVHSAMCSMHCALCTVQCAVCTVHCELCSMHCALSTVQYALRTVHCAVCSTLHCAVYSNWTVHCTMHIAHWTQHIEHCTHRMRIVNYTLQLCTQCTIHTPQCIMLTNSVSYCLFPWPSLKRNK